MFDRRACGDIYSVVELGVDMNRCEREIDAIRLKLYEETKNLTRKEQMKRTRDNAQKLAAEYGFTIIPSVNNRETKNLY